MMKFVFSSEILIITSLMVGKIIITTGPDNGNQRFIKMLHTVDLEPIGICRIN